MEETEQRIRAANCPVQLPLVGQSAQAEPNKVASLRGPIETWERLYTQYQERTSDSLSMQREDCLQSLCPEVLSDHLDLHASRLGSYDMMRAEIDTYLDIKTSSPLTVGDPMDVDGMGQRKTWERQRLQLVQCWALSRM